MNKIPTSALDDVLIDGISLRNYLKELLIRLWIEAESFNTHDPFETHPDADWQDDVYNALIEAGHLLDTTRVSDMDKAITQLIEEIFQKP